MRAIGAPLSSAERADHERDLTALRAALGEVACAAAWAAGKSAPLEHVLAEALGEAPSG